MPSSSLETTLTRAWLRRGPLALALLPFALLFRLLECIGENGGRSGGELLRQLADEAGQSDGDGFLRDAAPMLQRLRLDGVLAGTLC